MRRTMRISIICAGLAVATTAVAEPRPRACTDLARAARHVNDDAYGQAIEVVSRCLAVQPRNLVALETKAQALTGLRDYKGAEAAYRAFAAAESRLANRRVAEKLADLLKEAQSTLLEITVANGPATIYLDSRQPGMYEGLFCTAAPSCKQMVLRRSATVIAERPGFEPWTRRVVISPGVTTPLAITLVEKPSLVTVRTTPPGAEIAIDGAPATAPVTLPAGKHRVAVTLAGHRSVQRDIDAREGVPVELDVTLLPIVPVQIQPAGATLLVDGKPVTVEDGGIAVEPGPHELVARAPGFSEQHRTIPEQRAADYRIEVSLDRVIEVRDDPGTFTFRRKIAVAMGGVAVAGGATGAILGLRSRSLDRDAFDRCPSPSTPCAAAPQANDLNRRARARALQANVGFGVAGAAAVAAAILWFTGGRESNITVAPRVGQVAGLDVMASF